LRGWSEARDVLVGKLVLVQAFELGKAAQAQIEVGGGHRRAGLTQRRAGEHAGSKQGRGPQQYFLHPLVSSVFIVAQRNPLSSCPFAGRNPRKNWEI